MRRFTQQVRQYLLTTSFRGGFANSFTFDRRLSLNHSLSSKLFCCFYPGLLPTFLARTIRISEKRCDEQRFIRQNVHAKTFLCQYFYIRVIVSECLNITLLLLTKVIDFYSRPFLQFFNFDFILWNSQQGFAVKQFNIKNII